MSEWFEAESHVDRALDFFERGRWAEAEAELRKALALHPDRAEWHYNLGLTLEAAGREHEALSSYTRATELMPEETQPMLAAGLLAGRMGEDEQSLRWMERVLKQDETNEQALAQRIACLARLGRHEEAEVAFYMAQQVVEESGPCLAAIAESLLDREEHARAGWCLREALRISPNLPRVRGMLGRVFAATDQPRRAIQMYLRELRDDPGNIDTLLDYGLLLAELGRTPEASEKFRRVLELEPANLDAHLHLGWLALKSGRPERANLEFELVLRLDPEDDEARLGLAQSLLRMGRVDPARAALRDALARTRAADDPASRPASRRELGRLLLEAGLASEAAEVLRPLAEETPDDLDLRRLLAVAYYQTGDRERGAAASRRVLRHDRTCVRSMHNLAFAAYQEGRLHTAAGWIKRGLAIDRHDEGLRRLRVRVLLARLARGLGTGLARPFRLRRS